MTFLQQLKEKNTSNIDPNIMAVLKLNPDDCLDEDCDLYFKEPSELLELFNKLEAENLSLIQECQQVVSLYHCMVSELIFFDGDIKSVTIKGRVQIGSWKSNFHQDKN